MQNPGRPAAATSTRGRKSILSFDVGLRHLAYCHLSHDDFGPGMRGGVDVKSCRIEAWDVIDLGKVGCVEQCAESLLRVLHERFPAETFTTDLVLVERQPKSRSILMVAIQMLLCGYFTSGKIRGGVGRVSFISAQRKLSMRECPNTDGVLEKLGLVSGPLNHQIKEKTKAQGQRLKYADNKRYALASARHYLEHVLQDIGNLVVLDMYPKKDDLCDSLLQAIAFLEGGGATAAFSRAKKRRVKSSRTSKKATA